MILLLFCATSCNEAKAMGKQKQKDRQEGKDKTKEKDTPASKLSESFEYHKYLWVLVALAGTVTLIMGMKATGFTLLGIGTAGPVAVFLIESITVLFYKVFVGCVVLAIIMGLAWGAWLVYNKIKKLKQEHEDEKVKARAEHDADIKEHKRRQDKLVHGIQATKGKSKEEGGVVLNALFAHEVEEFTDEISETRKVIAKRV